MDNTRNNNMTIDDLRIERRLRKQSWSSWQTGFDAKYSYNYGYYSPDGICQRNQYQSFFRNFCFIMGLLFFTISILF